MATQVSICNEALTLLGQDAIDAADLAGDLNTRATALADVYTQAMEQLLRMHPWNFATAKADLTNLNETDEDYLPEWGFGYYYELPSGCLKVLYCQDRGIVWRVETYTFNSTTAKYLTTDESEISIAYIRTFTAGTDESLFDPLFVSAFSALLAAKTAYRITKDMAMNKEMWALFFEIMKDARFADSTESHVQQVEATTWVDARSGGYGYKTVQEPPA